jgi:fatty acid desaturase
MRALPEISDPVFTPTTYNPVDKFWLNLIRDERDLPFVYLTLKITFIMIPLGILLFLPFIQGWVWWLIAVAYFIYNNFVFKGPFGLMLHCTSHRPWFKEKYNWANNYLPWIVGPFFGQTPDTYASHHLGMHHRENNLEDDLSSTMHYQRDSLRHFFLYFINFFFLGALTLSIYFHKLKQKKLRNRVIRGELVFLAMCIAMAFISWQATLWVFVLPFILSRLIMMMGNWAQHSFLDAEDPGNSYKNSITCINTKYNHKCWNDGYHISHHIKPRLHWTLHPDHLKSNLSEYADNKAIVFEGIDFLGVWFFLMRKKYEKLARHLVNINGMYSSEKEAVALLKSRTQKVQQVKIDTVLQQKLV